MTEIAEASEQLAIFKRAREIVVETADMGGNQHKMLAFALVLSQFEAARTTANEVAKAIQADEELARLMKIVGIKAVSVEPNDLPPIPLLSIMLPEVANWSKKDIDFVRALLIPIWALIKEEERNAPKRPGL